MNADRRKRIEAIRTKMEDAVTSAIEEASAAIEEIKDEEQEAFDNLPESLQQGDKGQVMEAAISALDTAISSLGDIDVASVVSALEEAAA